MYICQCIQSMQVDSVLTAKKLRNSCFPLSCFSYLCPCCYSLLENIGLIRPLVEGNHKLEVLSNLCKNPTLLKTSLKKYQNQCIVKYSPYSSFKLSYIFWTQHKDLPKRTSQSLNIFCDRVVTSPACINIWTKFLQASKHLRNQNTILKRVSAKCNTFCSTGMSRRKTFKQIQVFL